jgi:hypothetical protein
MPDARGASSDREQGASPTKLRAQAAGSATAEAVVA